MKLELCLIVLVALISHLILIEAQSRQRLINMTCHVNNKKIISVHECQAKGLSLNLSLTLTRRISEPLNIGLIDWLIFCRFTYAIWKLSRNLVRRLNSKQSKIESDLIWSENRIWLLLISKMYLSGRKYFLFGNHDLDKSLRMFIGFHFSDKIIWKIR